MSTEKGFTRLAQAFRNCSLLMTLGSTHRHTRALARALSPSLLPSFPLSHTHTLTNLPFLYFVLVKYFCLIKIKVTYQLVSPKFYLQLQVVLGSKVWKLFLNSASSASPHSFPDDAILEQGPESCRVCYQLAESGLEVPDWTKEELC